MTSQAFAFLAAGIGLLGATLGAGLGIGRLASSTVEGMARQPEAANDLRGTAIVLAAFIEGVAIIAEVFALVFFFVS